jgi:signal transduction histidine kinase
VTAARPSLALPIAVATLALLAASAGLLAVLGPSASSRAITTITRVGSQPAAIVDVAALCLLVAGGTAWFGVSRRWLACVAFATAAAWLAPELSGSPGVTREARSFGMTLSPLLAPLVAHLAVGSVPGRVSTTVRWALVSSYAVALVAAVGRALTYDPFFDLDCAPVCLRGDNVFVLWTNVGLADVLRTIGWLGAIATGIGLAGWSAVRLMQIDRRRRRREWTSLAPATACGASLAWLAIARLAISPTLVTDVGLLSPILALGGALAWLGAGVTASLLADLRRAQQLARLADIPQDPDGRVSLRSILARTLDDDTVRICYPVGAGDAFVDEDGNLVVDPRDVAGRQVTAIERTGRLVALVDHAEGLDPHILTDEIGAAAQLAVDNERLEATVRAHLREMGDSRVRIVAASDAARGQLERDLHDGAQQRLLAVSYELRLARAKAVGMASDESLAQLDVAIRDVDRALQELRDVAHGIYPAILADAGLAAALRTLAGRIDLPVTLEDHANQRCGRAAEAAAYFTATEALRAAEYAGAERVQISLWREAGGLRLELRSDVRLDGQAWVRSEDRVAAAGGELSVEGLAGPAPDSEVRPSLAAGWMPSTTLSVSLPCA